MAKETDSRLGVRDAWDFYLTQHDVTVPGSIQVAIKEAFSEWLKVNGKAVVKEAVAEWLDRNGPNFPKADND